MRRRGWFALLSGVTVLCGAAAEPPVAPPPAPLFPPPVASTAQLRAETDALARERAEAARLADADPALAAERAKLRAQLLELLKRLNDRPTAAAPPVRAPDHPRPPRTTLELPEAGSPARKLAVAQNLYRDEDFDAALRAFRQVDEAAVPRDDRAFVKYMTGCCLRRLNKPSEAARVFREVADAKDDDFIAECAVWQIDMIRKTESLEAQLNELRSRRKTQ